MSHPSIQLHDGNTIPQLGLGVYQASGDDVINSVKWAIEAGYRHIDTASLYGNEVQVGRGIKESGVAKEQLFITTKVWNTEQGYKKTINALERSMRKLGVEYVDLYLIHSPVKATRRETWQALVELQKQGKVKSIGVSNYGVKHLEELFAHSDVKPVVNQIEITPFNTRMRLAEFCQKHSIVIAAYSPLTQTEKLRDARLVQLQEAHYPTRTPAQLLIRWGIDKSYVTLPKSVHQQRIKENADVWDWELKPEHMEEMDSWNEGLVVGWDPTLWA
ncbi:hypothetical protein HDU93_006645 [Gonapodya sp. JEL0774]|nr:hypothetical protein HDU93_006645 [Gonapodya sp. JEL0774]